MKKIIIPQKIIGFFLVFLMLWAVLVPAQFSNMVYAQELPNSVITGASITDTSDKPITNPIGAWRPFSIHVNYMLPDHKVHKGDTTTMSLPVGFAAAQPFEFQVKFSEKVIANGQIIDEKPAKIVLTYTDNVEKLSGVEGSFHFNTQINGDIQTQIGVIPVTLTVHGDQTVVSAGEVTFDPPQVTPADLIKAGWMDANDKTVGHYKININQPNGEMVNATLVDTLLTPSIEYVDGSFRVYEGVWVRNSTGTDIKFTGETDITSEFANKIDVQGNHFTISIGNRSAGKGLQIRYKVKLSYDPVVGEEIKNNAKLKNNSQDFSYPVTYKILDAGGSSEGYVYKIQIKKKAKDSGAPLSGATFDVIRVRSGQKVGTITSAADGTGELSGLLLDDYRLVETTAPNGYQLLAAPIEVKVDEFTANKVAYKEIENKPNTKTSVFVEKKWIGEVGNPILVDVKKQGSNTVVDTCELTPGNNWKHEFQNLDKYEADGVTLINYEVAEQSVPNGYTVSYEKDPTGVLIIKNKKEKITPPEKPDKPDKPDKPTPPNGPTPPDRIIPPDKPTPQENSLQPEHSTQTNQSTKSNHSGKENKTTPLKKTGQSSRRLPKTGDGANPAAYALAVFALGSLLTAIGYRRRKNAN